MGAQTHRDYKAQWIWAEVKTPEPFQFVRFRKSIKLDAIPKRATVYIAADTFYRLWVNGRLVMCGPARSSAGRATVDPVDVSRLLKPGENTVLVDALYCSKIEGHMFDSLVQAPGFLCEIEADGRIIAATDSTWDASEVMAWNRQAPRFSYQRGWVEDFDARADAAAWKPAIILGKVGTAPWKTVELRDIPLPAPLKEVRPVSVVSVQRAVKSDDKDWIARIQNERLDADPTAADHPSGMVAKGSGDTVLHGDGAEVTYDFRTDYVGFVGFEVTGKAGQVIEIAWNERLKDGSVRPHERSGGAQNVLRYTLRDGRQSFLAFNPQTMCYMRVALRGDGDVTLHRLSITEYRFITPANGDFACSDAGLNKVYKAARRTAMLNTLDTFMDCPSRERGAWLHDSYYTSQAVYAMFGDVSVNRRMIRQCAESQGYLDPPGMVQCLYPSNWTRDKFIPAHAMFWVMQAGLDTRMTGDTATTRVALPAVRRLMDTFATWRNSDGLLENAPSWNFIDWADMKTDGVCVALNAIYAATLDEAARMERVAGDARRASQFESDAARVRESLRTLCGDDLYYPDALVRNEQKKLVPSKERCEGTQYYAMWAGVPSEERLKRMWTAMRNDFIPNPAQKIQPIQGLTRGGLFSFPERLRIAEHFGDYSALIRDVRAMFLPMAESVPGTLWEHPWAVSSLCHGFGSMSAIFLYEDVLGIRLNHELTITPHAGGMLTWAKGYVTTTQGRVEVEWNLLKDRYEIRVSLPEGATAQVVLPDEAKAVWESGKAWSGWRQQVPVEGRMAVTVEPGIFSVTRVP